MKLTIIVCLFLCLTFGCSTTASDHATNTESNWEKRIVSKHKYPYAHLINPHLNKVNVLIVDGHRFEYVRGEKPFYLPVPKYNAILFVVNEQDKNYSVTYHIYKMDTKEDIMIRVSSLTTFGNSIGPSFSPETRDSVKVGEDGLVVLCAVISCSPDTKVYDYLDLTKQRVVARKKITYDKSGKIINQRDEAPPF